MQFHTYLIDKRKYAMKYFIIFILLFSNSISSFEQSNPHIDIYNPNLKDTHRARASEFFQAFDKNELEILYQLVSRKALIDTNLISYYRAKIDKPFFGFFGLYKNNAPLNEYKRIYFEQDSVKRKNLFAITLLFNDRNDFTVDKVKFESHVKLPRKLRKTLDKLDDNNLSREEKIKIVQTELAPPPFPPGIEAEFYRIDWEKNKISIDIDDLWLHKSSLENFDAANQTGFPISISSCIFNDSIGIPIWLQHLKNLHHIKIFALNNQSVPTEIGNLKVKNLILTFINVESPEVPSSLGNIEQLEELRISCENCRELPNTLTNLKNLKKFEFQGNNLDAASIQMVYSMGGTIKRRD